MVNLESLCVNPDYGPRTCSVRFMYRMMFVAHTPVAPRRRKDRAICSVAQNMSHYQGSSLNRIKNRQ